MKERQRDLGCGSLFRMLNDRFGLAIHLRPSTRRDEQRLISTFSVGGNSGGNNSNEEIKVTIKSEAYGHFVIPVSPTHSDSATITTCANSSRIGPARALRVSLPSIVSMKPWLPAENLTKYPRPKCSQFCRHPISKSVIIGDVPIAISEWEEEREHQPRRSLAMLKPFIFQCLIDRLNCLCYESVKESPCSKRAPSGDLE